MTIQKSATELRIEKLLADNQELRRDAERYRWLRSQHWNSSAICVVTDPKKSVRLASFCPSLEQLDYSVDSGMAIQAIGEGVSDASGQ